MEMLNYKGQDIKIVKYLAEKFPKMSYASIQKLLRLKDIKVNGKRINENVVIHDGDEIYVYASQDMINGISLKPNIAYEDDNIIVCDKPVGVEVESDRYNDLTLSVNNYLKSKMQKAIPTHRIDRNTRGLVVFAKNKESYEELLDAFKRRTIDKFYLAMVVGRPLKDQDHLYAYLYKDPQGSRVYISDDPLRGYEPIETKYKVKERFEGKTLLEVELITGKTHQIRAHLAYYGHFIIGDGKYGAERVNKLFKVSKQLLIASSLTLKFNSESELYYLNDKTFSVDFAVSFSINLVPVWFCRYAKSVVFTTPH